MVAGKELCGGSLLAESTSASLSRLISGDGTAAIFKRDVELMVRPFKRHRGEGRHG